MFVIYENNWIDSEMAKLTVIEKYEKSCVNEEKFGYIKNRLIIPPPALIFNGYV